jgi:hypothetical protein
MGSYQGALNEATATNTAEDDDNYNNTYNPFTTATKKTAVKTH